MNVVRSSFLVRTFSLFTGLFFLNMAFFLAEVSMLNIQDRQMLENIANMVLTGGLEEERDGHSAGHDVSGKYFSPYHQTIAPGASPFYLLPAGSHGMRQDLYLHADHSEKFSPPPDASPAS